MNWDAEQIRKDFFGDIKGSQVSITVTNNPLTSKGHVFETDGVFLIILNQAKINNDSDLKKTINGMKKMMGAPQIPETRILSKDEIKIINTTTIINSKKKRGRPAKDTSKEQKPVKPKPRKILKTKTMKKTKVKKGLKQSGK